MKIDKVGLIGLGTIGIPIAHKLIKKIPNSFFAIAKGKYRRRFEGREIYVNGEIFSPKFVDVKVESKKLSLCIICVKNYDIEEVAEEITGYIDDATVIMPLQNGIYAYDFFKTNFPNNTIIKSFIQGSNTQKEGDRYFYSNPGVISISSGGLIENLIYVFLSSAEISVRKEADINKAVWKKWMLNVAGNGVTALTGADYANFSTNKELIEVCGSIMREFLLLSSSCGIGLNDCDVSEVIDYYCTYHGSKKTSLLCDIENRRRTENEYIAGEAIRKAEQLNIKIPLIEMIYKLVKIKEALYTESYEMNSKNMFTDGIEYDEQLKRDMLDIFNKLHDKSYASRVSTLEQTEQTLPILRYAADNCLFYRNLKSKQCLTLNDFPVVNKIILNANYSDLLTVSDEKQSYHTMYTSGSTGIPFAVAQNMGKRRRHIADLKYFGIMAGYKDHDPMCYLRSKPTADLKSQSRDNIYQFDISNLTDEKLQEYYHEMCHKGCKALMAYPSTLDVAVSCWKKHFTNESRITTVISTSESMTEQVRQNIQDFFGTGVRICERYSNTENGVLGQEKECGVGFDLNWASYYFELLKLDNDEPAEKGELGRIVVTDLFNYAFPMIRYDTGDVGIIEKRDSKTLPSLKALYGRRMDLVFDTNGSPVSPLLLCRVLRMSKNIVQWQFIQESRRRYILKILPKQNAKCELKSEIDEFKGILGDEAEIDVEYVTDIPVLSSLKRKLIKSNLKRETNV